MSTVHVLTGAGHFGFGFILGALVAFFLIVIFKRNLTIRLYAPFIPFFLGLLAALPYTFHYHNTCDISPLLNVFVFYPWIHCNHLLIKLLANLYLVVVVCGAIYVLLLLHYILLVRRIRNIGWYSRRPHA